MQWFKRHIDFLRDESTRLSNDSNYQEIHQLRDNLFLSHGNIVVRLDKVYRHPILIVYTNATPYQLPLLIPLQEEIGRAELESLASGSISQLYDQIKPKIKFYHEQGLRHQNPGGGLCVVEWDSLDDGSKFYGITTILRRLRDWYAGHVTKVFPPDNQEVEFCAHFSKVNSKLTFLYPDAFVDPSLVSGQFYATQIANNGTSIYYGSLIDGISRTGVYEFNGQYLFTKTLDKSLRSSVDFQSNQTLVEKYIETKQLIRGLWFSIESILIPFVGFENLIKIIGNGNSDKGVSRFVKTESTFFRQLPDEFFVGIRYRNPRGVFEFQVFNVIKKEQPPGFELHKDPLARMKAILHRYHTVEAIPGEKLSEIDFHARNSVRADVNVLAKSFVKIFGVGALGSEIADSLGKAGVGNLWLFDNQTVLPHNPVRHVSGLSYVGIAKTQAMQEILSDHNPFIHVKSFPTDLFNSDGGIYALPATGVTVSSLANDNLEGFINEHAVIAGHTVFYARALRGGKVGRIFRVIPGKDACFQCINLYMQDKKNIFLKVPEDLTLPVIKNECNNPVRPASAADLKIIASIATRKIIEHLQEGESQSNHWIWSSEILAELNITTPFSMTSQFLPPHPNCFYCNHDRKLKVAVDRSVLEEMKKMVAEKPGLETGGVLAGAEGPDGTIIISHASGPGPDAVHKRTEFKKDVEFCQAFLDDLFIQSNRKKVYIGEWHSHPEKDNTPSGTDISSLSDIGFQKEYLTVNPTMIIFSNDGNPSCTVHPAGKRHYFVNLEILE